MNTFAGVLLLLLALPAMAQDSKRDANIVATFQRQVPCPATKNVSSLCPGYIVTYIRSLCSGGSNTAGNLKWQKEETARPPEKCEP